MGNKAKTKKPASISKEAKKQRSEQRQVRGILVEISGPTEGPWSALESRLKDLTQMPARCINAAIIDLIAAEHDGRKISATESIRAEEARFRAWATERLEKAKGKLAAEEKKKPPRKEEDRKAQEAKLKQSRRDVDRLARMASVELPSVIANRIERIANDAVTLWRKKRGKPPQFESGQPIPLRDGGWSVRDEDGKIVCSLKLDPKGARGVVVRARDKDRHAWSVLKMLCDPPEGVKLASAQIVYDKRARRRDGSRGKWMIRFLYSAPRTETKALSDGALVVHRGQHNLVTLLPSDGERVFYVDGSRYLQQLRNIDAQRSSMKRSRHDLGAAARGHGMARRYQTYDAKGEKRKRIVQTTVQQIGARVERLMRRYGYTRLVIEDYGGVAESDEKAKRRVFKAQMPAYKLKEWLQWVCDRNGWHTEEVPAAYISSTCPCCGNADTAQHNVHTGVFHCSDCDFERDADFVACVQMARHAGASEHWDKKLKSERRLVRAIAEPVAAE